MGLINVERSISHIITLKFVFSTTKKPRTALFLYQVIYITLTTALIHSFKINFVATPS